METSVVTDTLGRATTQVSDVWGKVIKVIPPTGPGVEYTYDTQGQLIEVEGGGAVITMTYNSAGYKTGMNDADMGLWQYEYGVVSQIRE